MPSKKMRFWARDDAAEAVTTCRASTGPNGTWQDGNRVEAPYTICADVRGWQVLGRINGCAWYVTQAVRDPGARHGFRTWREAYVAARRLYPASPIVLRTSDRRERQLA